MKLYRSIEEFQAKPNFSVVTSGMFDGVHLGHQKIIQRICSLAKENDGESVLITYWPHPRLVLSKENDIQLLSSLGEKAEELEKLGVDHLLCIPFTKEFANLSSEDFVQKILIETLHTKILVIGYDHHFGKNREGNYAYLENKIQDYTFSLEEIPMQDIENKVISSTLARDLIKSGDVKEASTYLGRNYSIKGEVVHGQKIGSRLGFPTANIKLDFGQKLLPKDGVYAVRVLVNGEEKGGMLNVGFRPSVKGLGRKIEVHLFDFDENLYGKNLKIYFLDRVRDEVKFETLEALKTQLQKDKEKVKSILSLSDR